MIDSEQTLCSCAEICKHKKKIDVYTCCASGNFNCLHALDPEDNFEPEYNELSSDIEYAINDPVSEFLVLLQNPRVQALFEKMVNAAVKKAYKTPEFKGAVETVIVTSDLEIPSRLRVVEKVTGTYNFDEWEEHEPTLSERINKLEERTVFATEKPIDPVKPEPLIYPKSTAEKKAVAFAEWLFKKPHSPTGIIQADDKEIKEFINSELPEKLRGKDKSERKIKMRIINKVKELYPDIIDTHKSDNGRHEISVFIKNSFQPNRTVRTPLILAGVML